MRISSNFSNPNFKGYIPVVYYSVNEEDKTCSRIVSKENIKKCHGTVVRNLNGTLKNKNQDLIELYKSHDKDYRQLPVVRSVYPDNEAYVLLVTGKDVDAVDQFAKPIGIAKSEAKSRTGQTKSYETRYAGRNYYDSTMSYLKNNCRRVKSDEGKDLCMRVFFTPKYNKNAELKKFEYYGADFIS